MASFFDMGGSKNKGGRVHQVFDQQKFLSAAMGCRTGLAALFFCESASTP